MIEQRTALISDAQPCKVRKKAREREGVGGRKEGKERERGKPSDCRSFRDRRGVLISQEERCGD